MLRTTLAIAFLATTSAYAFGQQDDTEKLKKAILDKVRARLDEEHKKIIERVGKIIDEELAKGVAPATEFDKKIAEIEKKLKDLDTARADLLKQLEDLKKQAKAPPPKEGDDEAKIKKDAKTKGPQSPEEAQELFAEANKDHEAKDFKTSILKFKYIHYQFGETPIGAASAYNVACGYALSGDKAKACDWLETSIKAGFEDYEHMKRDTDLDSIRGEKKYKQLMADK